MGLFLILVFVVVPLVELAVFVQISRWIGFPETTLLLLAVSVAGIFVVRHQGLGVYRRVREQVRAGTVPTGDLVNGLLILVAGLLLIIPGFVTDFVGLLLLLPPVRGLVRRLLRRRFSVRAAHSVVKVVNTRPGANRVPDPGAPGPPAVEVLPPAPHPLPPASPPASPPGGSGPGQ